MNQEVLLRYFASRTASHTMPQAVLISSEGPALRASTAQELARSLLCEARRPSSTCACAACARFARGVHPDFKLLEEDETARYIKIQAVREVLEWLWIAPFGDRAKVLLVRDAQRLTEEAASALLKTLEDPPPHRFFLLTARQSRDLFATIVSRCECVAVTPTGEAAGREESEISRAFAEDPSRAFEELATGSRETVSVGLGDLAAWVRDVLVWRLSRKAQVLFHRAPRAADWDSACAGATDERLLGFLAALDRSQLALKSNLNLKLVLTRLELEWSRP